MAAIDDLIADARIYASQVLVNAGSAMESAMHTINSIGIARPPEGFPNMDGLVAPPPPEFFTIRPYTGARFTPAELDAEAPEIKPLPALELPPEPLMPPGVHQYRAPPQPSLIVNDSVLYSMPYLNTALTVPTPPDLQGEIDGIIKPTIDPITIPPVPVITLPTFTPIEPTPPGAPPSDLDIMYRDQYESIAPVMRAALDNAFDAFINRYFPNFHQGIAKLEARLDAYLAGGSGLSPAIEEQIFNRALDKNEAEANRAMQKAIGDAARMGHTVMAPFVLKQVQEVDELRRDLNARSGTEIAVKAAEMEQNNLQFAVTNSIALRKMALDAGAAYQAALVQINGQALDYSKSVVDSVVKVYDIAVRYSEVLARLAETRARVYETLLRGALAAVEVYKAQVDMVLAQVSVDKAEIDLYVAQLHAVEVEASIYKTQVEACVAQAGMERVKVELYKAQVDAFAAQVNGQVAKFDGYKAAVSGELAAVNASVEVIRGYSAQSDNYRTIIQARTTALEAQARENEAALKVYQEQIAAFRAINSATAEAVRAEIESWDIDTKSVITQAQLQSDWYRSQLGFYDTSRRALVDTAQLVLEDIRQTNAIQLQRAQAIASISSALGGIYANVSQAALSGINTLADKSEITSQ